MPTVNLHTNYSTPLATAMEYSSVLGGTTSDEYKWTGASTIVVTSIDTEALTDYDRTAASGRYGTTSEVGDSQQVMTLQKDRSYSKARDKGNYQEASFQKTGAMIVKAFMNEQVGPELERFAIGEFVSNCGQYVKVAAEPDSSSIVAALAAIEVAFDDAFVPKTDRYVALANKYVAALRQSLTHCDNVTDKMLIKNIVGNFGTLHILGIPASELPTDVYGVAWQKKSVVNPKTIDDCKVSNDVPGISGLLVESRIRYGAFVVAKKSAGVVALVKSSSVQATPTATKGQTTTTLASANATKILYTLDGSDPRYSATATVYSAAFSNPDAGTILKAVAYKTNGITSEVLTHTCV